MSITFSNYIVLVVYNVGMKTMRRIGAVLAAALLPFALFAFGLTFSLYQVLGSPDHIKRALDESGVYETFAADSLDSLQRGDEIGSTQLSGQDLPLDNPEVKNIVSSAFSGNLLREQTPGFLDATYAWMRGDTQTIDFTIDLRAAKGEVVNNLATYADSRIKTLPVCQNVQDILELQNADALAILDASCIPPNFDRATAVSEVRSELKKMEFLKDPTLTPEDFSTKEGETLEAQLEPLRNGYQIMETNMYAVGAASLVLLFGTILLPLDRCVGLRRGGTSLITVGAFSALVAWSAAYATGRVSNSFAADGGVQATLTHALSILAADVRNWWIGVGVAFSLLGIAALVVSHFTRKHSKENTLLHEAGAQAKQPQKDTRTQANPTKPEAASANDDKIKSTPAERS